MPSVPVFLAVPCILPLPPWRKTCLSSQLPDEEKLYMSNARDTTVTAIDIPSLNILRTIRNLGTERFGLDFGPWLSAPPSYHSEVSHLLLIFSEELQTARLRRVSGNGEF